MNIPNLPFGKKEKTDYFLSLILRDEKASAVIFEEQTGKINVVGEHTENFTTPLEDSTEEELLNIIDKTVSTAERTLPPGVESHKTIFGVKDSWTDAGKIKQEYLLKLKKVSDELEFKPMGFLVISEAIAHLLQKEEGAPISAVLAEIGEKNITLSLIKAGKVIETKTGVLEDSASKTTDKLLHHFRVSEILPSRIIIFDSGKEALQQEFISHTWSKALPFLHVPQISTLPANYDARAVLNGAATQMGLIFAEVTLANAAKEDKTTGVKYAKSLAEETEDKTIAEAASEFGFSGADVKADEEPVKAPEEAEAVIETATPPEKPMTAIEDSPHANIQAAKVSEIPENELVKQEKKPLPINAAAITQGLLGFYKKIPLGSLLQGANRSRKVLLIGGIPLLLVFLLILFWLFMRSATVTLDIQNQQKSNTESITFSSTDPTDADKGVIAADFPQVSEDGKISTTTTGKKQTGDEAKGTVTIFNNSDGGITLPTGTTITSSNNLDFTLDKPVTVASASGDVFSGTKPGTGTVTVTASKFGTGYNLPSGTKFDVSGHSDVAAKNDNAFSGGTTKNIQVVAQADLDKLSKTILTQLEDDAKGNMAKKVSSDSQFLPNFVSETFDKKSFSAQVGDQANDVSITASISYKGVAFKKSDMEAFAAKKLGGGELTVNNDQLSVSAQSLKESGGDVSGKLTIKAGLIPQIDQTKLANQIKGKSFDQALNQINSIPQMEHSSITIFPPIPLLPKLLPFSPGKIKIIINKNG